MELLDWVRVIVAGIPAFYWIVCLTCNFCVGVIYAAKAKSPSALPIVGSIAGIITVLLQPFTLPSPVVLFWILAVLPDIVWGALGILGSILDRKFPERITRQTNSGT